MSEYTRMVIDWTGTRDDLERIMCPDEPYEEDYCVAISLLSGQMYEYLHNESGLCEHRDLLDEVFAHPLCADIFIDYRYLPDEQKTRYNDLSMFKSFLETEYNCRVENKTTDSALWEHVNIWPRDDLEFEYAHRTNSLRFRDDQTIVFLYDENGNEFYKMFGNGYQGVLEYLKVHLFKQQ